MIDKINITEFPKNVFVELPDDYRNMLFQMIFLDSKTAENARISLKKHGVKENVFGWRRGNDRNLPQLINLESLLFLFNKSQASRLKIQEKISLIKLKIKNSDKRIEKSDELITLVKCLRYILNGSSKMAEMFNMNSRTLNHYITNTRIKRLPLYFVVDLIEFAENKILCFNFTIEELQGKIISYQAHHGKCIKPEFQSERKLPIEVTPEFESIVYHLMGDGQ